MGQPYELLTGVGTIYVAPAGEAMPALDATPAGNWVSCGETDDGVTVRKTQNIETFSSDQRTGKKKAIRTEEGVEVETSLQEGTLENLANVTNGTVSVTAPGVGTIGKKSMNLHAGAEVTEFAILFRGKSPYGNYPGQYYVPRGYMDDDVEQEYKKDGVALIPMKFMALEDLDAATEDERFGVVEYQNAAALP